MTNKIFDKIHEQTNQEQKSFDWYQRKVREIAYQSRTPSQIFDSDIGQIVKGLSLGNIYMFIYTAKWYGTKKLPYYDMFPLTIPFDKAKKGFYGLNLHYLSKNLRTQLFKKLLETSNNPNLSKRTKLELNYEMLRGFAQFPEAKPCIKQYLNSHVKSNFMKIEPKNWKMAIYLPTEEFVGASKQKAQSDSRRKVYG